MLLINICIFRCSWAIYSFTQAPLSTDVNNIGNRTSYVFGMAEGEVYIYNKSGVADSFPVKALKK